MNNRNHTVTATGRLDDGFTPGTGANGTVNAIAVQSSDGSVLVGGTFTAVNGTSCNRIARLNSTGSLDTGFNPGVSGGSTPMVHSIVLQPDGKIILGGAFTTAAGQPRQQIARLNLQRSAVA